jgi:hypothetical protein
MKVYCCYTPAHKILFDNYFRPSIPPSFELRSTVIDLQGRGDFLSREFLACIRAKLDLVVASIRENPGEVILWSDIDIIYFDVRPEELRELLGTHDIAFQVEAPAVRELNTGFLVIRCGPATEAFFLKVSAALQVQEGKNEQMVINELLETGDPGISWTRLPAKFYARSHGWPPPVEIAIYHANKTIGKGGIERKTRQFEELQFIRKHGAPARLLTTIKYAALKVLRFVKIG